MAIALGVRKYTRSEISQLLVICVATITVFVALNNWLSHLPLPAGWAASPDDDRLLAIAQATPFIQAVHGFFHAPLWEETLFRGPIALAVFAVNSGATRRYLNKTLGLVILVVISLVSTLTFGLAHAPYNGLNVVLAGGFGAVAAVTTIRYRSILPGVLIHAFYNAMVQIA
ncbi:CPBP family intramembrane glutamic endopeptidase [Arthrobacter alpinus]|uniref:CPBP family intramembrane glutamic endopeptidase n=1 Tax=Arthrobacter alpinus TaxID=656366 RepID=UPI001364D785|nr:CPBP family intramembrane glutamic endopeptidase [Arthrobacter alpinus]